MSGIFSMHLIISLIATAGLGLSAYIHFHKRTAKPLVCPIGYHCDAVIHSDYSRFLGCPVEVLGILYYALVAVSFWAPSAYPILQILSGAAFGFSLYLVGVQMFVLRQWCTWCLISAALCTGIFILTFL